VFTTHFNTLSDGDATAELHIQDGMVWFAHALSREYCVYRPIVFAMLV